MVHRNKIVRKLFETLIFHRNMLKINLPHSDSAQNVHPKLFLGNLKVIKTSDYQTGNHIFKVNNRNTRTKCEICSKLTIKIPERRRIYDPFKYL